MADLRAACERGRCRRKMRTLAENGDRRYAAAVGPLDCRHARTSGNMGLSRTDHAWEATIPPAIGRAVRRREPRSATDPELAAALRLEDRSTTKIGLSNRGPAPLESAALLRI